ncbi:hypothetical protein UVI_02015210 [Ustilaginoidea virens]|uniref:Hydrophobic surface binding protein A n=1 Tax=Ustilaginoidea virens TaxID=1159556 RepID=A0A1B5KS00_USTVR|nr:hypothetical protein UVI_02015210 [Ustilaginoidea virens]
MSGEGTGWRDGLGEVAGAARGWAGVARGLLCFGDVASEVASVGGVVAAGDLSLHVGLAALPTPFAKMLSVKNILFLAVAAAGSVIKRDVSQTKSNLKTINSDTQSVTSAVNDYNGGGMFAAMPIINAEQTLDNDIQSATNNANKLGTISTADAKALIDYIGNTIQPSMRTALKALKSKKPQFDADQLTGVVHDTLQSLQSDTDKLADALIKAVPASQKSQAKAPKDKIDADFNDAIAYFSS